MGWSTNFLTGLAEYLAAGNVGTWTPVGVFDPAATVPPISLRALPDAPDRAIAVTTYPIAEGDDAGLADVLTGLQVRTRGTTDPTTVDDVADAVFDRIHGASMLTLGGVHVTLIRRQSGALLGPDDSGRFERTDNYYVHAARPTGHRPD